MEQGITKYFGENLALLLADKIVSVYKNFDKKSFVKNVKTKKKDKNYTERVELIADELHNFLPQNYEEAVRVLMKILGPENPAETGMFKNYYWMLPIGKYVEKYGIDNLKVSVRAIEEITKRNTGEYAVRPFIRKYPKQMLVALTRWAKSKNFHLRRLASEGPRPKLPWAAKLDTFIDQPKPIFDILEILKEDEIKFVKKSVANHLRDYLKVNKIEAEKIIKKWSKSKNEHTLWILKHAQRK